MLSPTIRSFVSRSASRRKNRSPRLNSALFSRGNRCKTIKQCLSTRCPVALSSTWCWRSEVDANSVFVSVLICRTLRVCFTTSNRLFGSRKSYTLVSPFIVYAGCTFICDRIHPARAESVSMACTASGTADDQAWGS